MGSLGTQLIESFTNTGAALVRGSIVRPSGNGQAAAALASDPQGLLGVFQSAGSSLPTGSRGSAVTAGEAVVRLETGLAPAAGDVLYLSATVAGRATTTLPTPARVVGVVTNAAGYATTGTVQAIVVLAGSGASSSSGGGFADWDITLARYYFVDNENGDDANLGYIDAAPGTTFTVAQGDAVALKTLEELRNRVPRIGAERIVVIFLKPRSDGGNYLNKAGASDFLDTGYLGYSRPIIRASDFTNDTTDRARMGAVIAEVGPNADGSWTTQGFAAPVITIDGVQPLPAADALAGLGVHFVGDVTPGLLAQGNNAHKRLSDSTFNIGNSVAVPAVNDDFWLTRPGVKVTVLAGTAPATTGTPPTVMVGGIEFTATTSLRSKGNARFAGCRFAALTLVGTGIDTLFSYQNELNTTILNGPGCDFRGAFTALTAERVGVQFSAFHAAVTISRCPFVSISSGVYSTLKPLVNYCGLGGQSIAETVAGTASVTIGRPDNTGVLPFFLAGFTVRGTQAFIAGVSLDLATAGIVVDGECNLTIKNLSGAVTGIVLDLATAVSSRVVTGTGITATGSVSEIRMAASETATFASLAISGQIDGFDNVINGPAGLPVRRALKAFSGAHTGDAAGAAVSYMADHGTLATGAIATVINYPMPPCRVRELRAKCSVNPLGADLIVTVYRNGLASGITVTIPAGSTALQSHVASEVQFSAGDLLDLRCDSNAAGAVTALLAATLIVW